MECIWWSHGCNRKQIVKVQHFDGHWTYLVIWMIFFFFCILCICRSIAAILDVFFVYVVFVAVILIHSSIKFLIQQVTSKPGSLLRYVFCRKHQHSTLQYHFRSLWKWTQCAGVELMVESVFLFAKSDEQLMYIYWRTAHTSYDVRPANQRNESIDRRIVEVERKAECVACGRARQSCEQQ